MLITFFRAIVLYIVVLFVMRLMGKREIGQLQPFELAISIMIADLAATPMTESGIPITNGIIPILGLLVMHLIISMIKKIGDYGKIHLEQDNHRQIFIQIILKL